MYYNYFLNQSDVNIQNVNYYYLLINSFYYLYTMYTLNLNFLFPSQIEIYIRTNFTNLFVKPLQDTIIINPFIEDATLIFFRFHNNTNKNLLLLTTYSILPYEIYLYFVKLQCFCFDKIQIKSFQTIDLPVLFCLSKENLNTYQFNQIVLIYNVFVLNS